MGACQSGDGSDEGRIKMKGSMRVDKYLKVAQEEDAAVKLLLLGSGNSGKSTFLKQFKKLYSTGFSDEERRDQAKQIMMNVTRDILIIADGVKTLEEVDLELEPKVAAVVIALDAMPPRERLMANELEYGGGEDAVVEPGSMCIGDAVRLMWSDPAMQQAWGFEGKIKDLEGDPSYWMRQIDLVCAEGYLPTDDDLLKVRTRTVGIAELDFKFEGILLKALDVGGQRNERKKWIHCFDNVHAIMFICSAAEYDKVLLEDGKTNRMVEALDLFQQMITCPYFTEKSFMLFMNKSDLLDEKVEKGCDIGNYFPNYRGKPTDVEGVRDFIQSMYQSVWRKNRDDEESVADLFCQFTCGTDTNQVEAVVNTSKHIFMSGSLNSAGFV